MSKELTKILPDDTTDLESKVEKPDDNPFGTPDDAESQAALDTEAAFNGDPPPAKEPKAKPATVAALEPEPAKPKHPAWLTSAAAEVGLEPDLVARLDTDTLGMLVGRETRKLKAAEGKARTEQSVQPPVPAEEDVWSEFGEYEDQDDTGQKVQKKFDKNTLHPAVAKPIEAMAKKIKSLEKQLAAKDGAEQQTAAQREAAAFDAEFSKYANLGNGSAEEVRAADEDAFVRRQMVFAFVKGKKDWPAGTTYESAVALAVKKLFGAVTVAAPAPGANGNGKPAASPYDANTVARPTPRATEKKKGRAKAEETAQAFIDARRAALDASDIDDDPDAIY
jgi:hypothetical protein